MLLGSLYCKPTSRREADRVLISCRHRGRSHTGWFHVCSSYHSFINNRGWPHIKHTWYQPVWLMSSASLRINFIFPLKMPIYAFVTTQKVYLFIVQCSWSLPHSSVDCSVLLFMLMFRVLFLCSLFHVLFQSSVPCSLLMLHVPFLCSLFCSVFCSLPRSSVPCLVLLFPVPLLFFFFIATVPNPTSLFSLFLV